MRLVSTTQNQKETPQNKNKESDKQKERGRISLPQEQNLEEFQSKNENMLRMPFSLNDQEVDEINSPFQRNISNLKDFSQSPSVEIQMENDEDLIEVDEHNLYPDFEMTEFGDFYKQNVSEKPNKSNQIVDSSHFYLNLSNKVVQCKDDYIVDTDDKKNANKSFNYHQTTEKTGHNTGAITWTGSKKKTEKNQKSDSDQDKSVISKVKSFTTRKRNLYSDFDDQSEQPSEFAEVKHSVRGGKSKIKDIRPNVIKGFCSSISSSISEIDKQSSPEKEVKFKHDFYNSGNAFYSSQNTPDKNLGEDKAEKKFETQKKSQKNIGLDFKLSLDSSVENSYKTEK